MIYDEKVHQNQDKYPDKNDYLMVFLYRQGKCYIENMPMSSKSLTSAMITIYEEHAKKPLDASLTNYQIIQALQSHGFLYEKVFNEAGYKAELKAWNAKDAERKAEYKSVLYRACKVENELGDMLYENAWKDHHSSGYGEVENAFDDLVDLANSIIDYEKRK